MKLLNINLCNFRRYERALFNFHPSFTVLIGDNGKGKTTVLDAIAVMLSTYFQGSGIKTGQSVVKKDDARLVIREKGGDVFFEPQLDAYLLSQAQIHDETIQWRRVMGDRGGNARELVSIGSHDRSLIRKGENVDLPVLLYYGAGRLWDIHRDVQTEKPGSQLDAYRFCLDPKSDQKAFERWLKRLSYSELQEGKIIPILSAVKQAVTTCISDAQEFYYDTKKDQIMIRLNQNGLIPFNNLSDGYRNMVAMVADIAHRSARLNPHFEIEAAKKTQGVVLIDEIDLHLHPKWQRRVVRDLQTAFPNIQFIATSHSPFIIQSLEAGEIIDLNQPALPEVIEKSPAGIAAPGPADGYSNRSIEDIAEGVMGVEVPQRSHRYQQMTEAAKAYYRLLKEVKKATPAEKGRLKAKLDELSAPFSDNVAYHAFLEMERIDAGLGKSGREDK